MQNLNLYQVERRRRGGPRRRHMLLGLVLLALFCLLHAGWQYWQLRDARQQLVLTEAQASEQESVLATAKAGFVEPQLDPQLPAEVAARQAENGQLQGLLNYLRVLAEQQSTGFVPPLQALAEHHPQGRLWLTGIHLDQGGTQLRLQGRAQSQQLLPGYLDALGRSPVFSGREFARLDVERGEDGLLDFDLSSRPADQEKANE